MRPLLLLALLAGCAAPVPPRAPAPQDRIAAECALLGVAAQAMTASGTPAHDGLAEGCPGVTARDTRPLPRQMESLRAATAAGLPAGIAPGSRAEAVFRRLLTRGVPPELAVRLTADPAFAAATR